MLFFSNLNNFLKNSWTILVVFIISIILGDVLSSHFQSNDFIVGLLGAWGGYLLQRYWEFSKNDNKDNKAIWTRRILALLILLVSIGGYYYLMYYRLTVIYVVGNSYGGLRAEIGDFNKKFARRLVEPIKAELIDDWENYDYQTRWESAINFLQDRGKKVDVIELDGVWIPSASSSTSGYRPLLPLDDFYERDIEDGQDFFLKVLNVGKSNENQSKLYGIPIYVDSGIILYRKDLLGELEDAIT